MAVVAPIPDMGSTVCCAPAATTLNKLNGTMRQKRQSCEACRARKLRCSGEQTGCARCTSLSLTCKFQDKGNPGRPRKRQMLEQQQQQQQRHKHSMHGRGADLNQSSPSGGEASTVASTSGHSHNSPAIISPSAGSPHVDPMLSGCGDFGSFSMGGLMDHSDYSSCSFPLDLLSSCHPNGTHSLDLPDLSSDASGTTGLLLPSCDCVEEVTESIRTLRRAPLSHSTVRNLRVGLDITERLLSCPVCYDTTKSPRITIQNVLLIGRLMLEITSGYQRYVQWLRESCTDLVNRGEHESVYLIPGLEISPVVSLKISGKFFQDLIIHGLQNDTQRMSEVGKRFAQRQRNRHLIGHEACPDSEGRCWREERGLELDPLDVCPQNSAAATLAPCYRIVDEVQSSIRQVVDSLA